MNHMHREILSVPDLLEGTIRENAPRVEALAKALREKAAPTVHIAARGSSANAGLYFAYACEILAGLPVHMLMPSVLTVYEGTLRFGDGLLLAVTQGGRGSDIRFLMDAAKAQGCRTAAICNEEDSPIAREADTLLPMKLGIEQAMAATKTFTAELLLGGMLALALAGRDLSPMDRVPELLRRTYGLEERLKAAAESWTGVRSCHVLGRGYLLSVAREVCCKLQEACFVNAAPFSQADFLHGPLAMVERGDQILYFHRDDATGAFSLELLEKLEAAGAKVLLFTDSPAMAEKRPDAVLLPGSDELLAPFVFTGACQLFACHLAVAKGLDPDNSRNLNKYTVTM
ncbi:MAG: SIS domain-containing protein [Clostridia bacterium]|nr:SIS domain-containing protein [Clostridia bacterium]